MAAPFIGEQFTFPQPDGSTIEVKGFGNQYQAVFETLEGYTVVKNPRTGFYEPATLSPDGMRLVPAGDDTANLQPGLRAGGAAELAEVLAGTGEGSPMLPGGRRCDTRRLQNQTAARAAMAGMPLGAPPQRETLGTFVGLCLLIDFEDEPATISKDEVEKFCNKPGYDGFGNSGSVFDYFHDNSIGRVHYTNIVTDYYRAQHPRTHYTDPSITYGTRARQLIVEALEHWKSEGLDFSPLTADSNGFVYALNVYYAGTRVNEWSKGLWPHAWRLASKVPLVPGKGAFDYQFTDMTSELTLGTFCHENGHMLCDYPDLYDKNQPKSGGVGSFCLMCAGGNLNKKNPAQISAYLKRLSGWAKSVEAIEHNKTISLGAGTNEFALYPKNSTEYFILENRQKSGWDKDLRDEGLAIWHVDEADGHNNNEQMTPEKHYELSLEQADGLFEIEKHNDRLGDADDLYGQSVKVFSDTTTPNSRWWDGTKSKLKISEISDPGSIMTFKTSIGDAGSGTETISEISSPGAAIPDNRPEGVTDSIQVTRDETVVSVRVGVKITHGFRGDLQVSLLSPVGQTVVLHPIGSGGSNQNLEANFDEASVPGLGILAGSSAQGAWRLLVQDLASGDTGTLDKWTLELDVQTSGGPLVLEESPGTHIPDDDPAGITRVLNTDRVGNVESVEVSVEISHTFIGDLTVALVAPDTTVVVLHNDSGGGTADIRTTYTESNTPALATLQGKSIAGNWSLKVSDNMGEDVGKLNRWKLTVHPA